MNALTKMLASCDGVEAKHKAILSNCGVATRTELVAKIARKLEEAASWRTSAGYCVSIEWSARHGAADQAEDAAAILRHNLAELDKLAA